MHFWENISMIVDSEALCFFFFFNILGSHISADPKLAFTKIT